MKNPPYIFGMIRRVAQSLAFGMLIVAAAGCALFREESPQATPPSRQVIAKKEPWIEIDSRTETLTLHREGMAPLVFTNLAFGAAGVKEKRRMGDDVTPRGEYTIGWIRTESKFIHFIGLNYPSMADADRGLASGVIHRGAYERIKRAVDVGATPPQDTALGGFIGIHGVGKGSLEVHQFANWTAGCVAMDNQQIRRLKGLIHIGMRVQIK